MADSDSSRTFGEREEEPALFSAEDMQRALSGELGQIKDPLDSRDPFDSLMHIGESQGFAALVESVKPMPPPPSPPPKRRKSKLLVRLRDTPSLTPWAVPDSEAPEWHDPWAEKRPGDHNAIVVAVGMMLVALAVWLRPATDSQDAGAQAAAALQSRAALAAAAVASMPAISTADDKKAAAPASDDSSEDAEGATVGEDAADSKAASDKETADDGKGEGAQPLDQQKLAAARMSMKKKKETKAKGAFNRDAARSAMFSAASRASGCRRPGAPKGRGRALVTIAPSGSVSNVSISGPMAGTRAGSCAASVFRMVRIPPFDGSSVTLGKSFRIR